MYVCVCARIRVYVRVCVRICVCTYVCVCMCGKLRKWHVRDWTCVCAESLLDLAPSCAHLNRKQPLYC